MSKKSPTSKARTARHPYSIRFREEYGAFGALEREQDWTCATSSWGNKTMPRANDARQQKGHRILFAQDTQVDAWYTARMLKRLTPMHQRWAPLG